MTWLLPIGKVAFKSIISVLMSFATEEFFKEIFVMLAEMAAKSTKTKFDDRIVDKMKEAVEADKEEFYGSEF